MSTLLRGVELTVTDWRDKVPLYAQGVVVVCAFTLTMLILTRFTF